MNTKNPPSRTTSVTECLALRERLGLRRYRKTAPREPEKRQLLLDMALKKIYKAERNNFILIGHRKRRVNLK